MSTDVAEMTVETLQNAGAKRCYGVVGDTLNQFTDALRQSDIEWIGVGHQEMGGFVASGEEADLACYVALFAHNKLTRQRAML